MVEATLLENNMVFKNMIHVVQDLTTNGHFYFDENSVFLQAMDQSQVSLVVLNFKPEFFETYRCDHLITFEVNVGDLYKILKFAKAEDFCTMAFSDCNEFISFRFEDNKGRQQEASLKIFKANNEKFLIPEQIFSCKIEMPSAEFEKICRDIYSFSDKLMIDAINLKITFRGSGNFASYKTTYSCENYLDDETQVSTTLKENINTEFSLKKLILLVNFASTISKCVYVSISNNRPIQLRYNVPNASLHFFLAPII